MEIIYNSNKKLNTTQFILKCKKVKLTLKEAVKAHRVETLRFPHFLDNWLTDGGEVVSLTRWPPFTHPRKIPDTHFC
jgi:hypothetical protein